MAEPDREVMADEHPPFRPGKPPGRWGFPLLVGALIAAAGALYYFGSLRPESQPVAPAVQTPQAAAPASVEPRIEHPIEAPPVPQLPALAESDSSVREGLAGLFGSATFEQLFQPQNIIRCFVATI